MADYEIKFSEGKIILYLILCLFHSKCTNSENVNGLMVVVFLLLHILLIILNMLVDVVWVFGCGPKDSNNMAHAALSTEPIAAFLDIKHRIWWPSFLNETEYQLNLGGENKIAVSVSDDSDMNQSHRRRWRLKGKLLHLQAKCISFAINLGIFLQLVPLIIS